MVYPLETYDVIQCGPDYHLLAAEEDWPFTSGPLLFSFFDRAQRAQGKSNSLQKSGGPMDALHYRNLLLLGQYPRIGEGNHPALRDEGFPKGIFCARARKPPAKNQGLQLSAAPACSKQAVSLNHYSVRGPVG